MKKIYESELNGWDESASKVHVYALESDEEFWKIDEMNFNERCDMCNVCEEHGVMPGAMYHRYSFNLSGNHFIMTETIALNV